MAKIAAIHTGPDTHLDHLAPLCFLLEAPLIVTEKEHFTLGKHFYPMIEMRYVSLEELTLEYIAKNFDVLIECGKFWAMELKPLIKMFFHKDLRVIFSPHGNSDKESFLNLAIEQDIQLVYGPQMRELKVGKNVIEMGNLRLWFYQKYKEHFDALARDLFPQKKKTVLYTPTWSTKASSSSFFEHIDEIVSSLSKSYQLLIKLHPLLEENHPAHFHHILGKYEDQATFLLEFPAIYPLLERTDIYLGDTSSVGYDFLAYDRPMFFLNGKGNLMQCGQIFKGSVENSQKELSAIRRKIYREAFGKECIHEKIKTLLLKKVGSKSTDYSESSGCSTTTAT